MYTVFEFMTEIFGSPGSESRKDAELRITKIIFDEVQSKAISFQGSKNKRRREKDLLSSISLPTALDDPFAVLTLWMVGITETYHCLKAGRTCFFALRELIPDHLDVVFPTHCDPKIAIPANEYVYIHKIAYGKIWILPLFLANSVQQKGRHLER